MTTTTTYGYESSDLFAVLNQLDTNAFPNSRVRLFGLDSDLLKNDTLSVGRSSGRRCLVDVSESALFIRLVRLEIWSNRTGISAKKLGIEQDGDRPIGSSDDRCEACELLGDHGVCWLEDREML